jgi:hypothetical protein
MANKKKVFSEITKCNITTLEARSRVAVLFLEAKENNFKNVFTFAG